MVRSNRDCLYSDAFVNFFRRSVRSRSTWVFVLAILGILSLFQIALLIIIKYASHETELQVAQASLDAKLFQDLKIEEHIDLKSEFGISNASPKIFIPSQYFCGFPVPKGNAQAGYRPSLIGSMVLVKGGLTPIIGNYDRPPLSEKNLSVSARDFNFYASVFCAGRLISNLPNPTLARYITFLERVLSVSLSKVEKAALNVPNLCVNKTNGGGDLTAHVLVRAFAIGNQVASVYTLRSNSAATLNDLNVRLFVASTTPQSRLESLALLTALLTTWAGNDERKFQSYLNAFKGSSVEPSKSGRANQGYRWVEYIEHPRFCVPSATFSCTCPRQLLVHSVAERRRTRLMASLRQEAASVHSSLPPSVHSLTLAVGADKPSNSDWPHRVLALLSEALCNQAVPLTPNDKAQMHTAQRTIKICEHRQGNEVTNDCISESLVQRIWEITSYAERKLENSSAQWEFAKLASYPFLRTVEQEITKISSDEGKDKTPWLQVYIGQPDSIYLLLKALNISVGTLDHRRSAGRFIIEIHRSHFPQDSSPITNLRFLLDGVDIGESFKPVGLCEDKPLICSAEKFVGFLKESKFWGPILGTHLMNSSEDAFKFVCNSDDFRTLMK
ncbi:unnamed protein product [Hymenolepis diminuta]|uniref:Uncharacterized protein n=1 Tax=Hymenolepis diminuta TaxID=6216 RepID=A0A564YVX1_HYMDI|nr:unnamed protein product [Hymenolepis diminuta]